MVLVPHHSGCEKFSLTMTQMQLLWVELECTYFFFCCCCVSHSCFEQFKSFSCLKRLVAQSFDVKSQHDVVKLRYERCIISSKFQANEPTAAFTFDIQLGNKWKRQNVLYKKKTSKQTTIRATECRMKQCIFVTCRSQTYKDTNLWRVFFCASYRLSSISCFKTFWTSNGKKRSVGFLKGFITLLFLPSKQICFTTERVNYTSK